MKIDESMMQSLSSALEMACSDYHNAMGSKRENFYLFRMTFIKSFLEDVRFLNTENENPLFYHRYAVFIIRNMAEQTMEFLYLIQNECLIDEYLGLSIDLNKVNEPHTPLEGARRFGKKRFVKNRKSMDQMAKAIGEYQKSDGSLALYDIFGIYSEYCHNSYFDAFLDDVSMINNDIPTVGLTEEHVTAVYALIMYVISEFAPKSEK